VIRVFVVVITVPQGTAPPFLVIVHTVIEITSAAFAVIAVIIGTAVSSDGLGHFRVLLFIFGQKKNAPMRS
jgi:hypothetical protein